jgi:hypothetical protein
MPISQPPFQLSSGTRRRDPSRAGHRGDCAKQERRFVSAQEISQTVGGFAASIFYSVQSAKSSSGTILLFTTLE